MDVVKLWSSLLANCAIGSSSVCSIPTAYFVQGTADVQLLSYAQNNNNNNNINNNNNNNETVSIADSDSDNSCYQDRPDLVTSADFAEDDYEEDDSEDNNDEDEKDGRQRLERERLVAVRVVEEGGDIEDDEVSGSDYNYANNATIEILTESHDGKHQGKKQTSGKQTQTKIHRNR
ncbi:hypothetical protein QE152_g29011 [Popillia japonica]|uniref:Uncharacterized protein n=1 Tax=Popillia japonica TaxID=7064 RepID=A0AAW1JJD3_POPJA